MLAAKFLQQHAPDFTRALFEIVAEIGRAEIAGDGARDRAGTIALGSNVERGRAERHLIGRHEARRPRHAGEPRTRISVAAKVVMRSALAVDPSLHVLRQLHCFVLFWSSESHGLSGAAGSG